MLEAESRHLQFDHVSVAYLIDALEVLGLLKLDQPPSALSRATDIIAAVPDTSTQYSVSDGGIVIGKDKARQITASLAAAGFKIVEA